MFLSTHGHNCKMGYFRKYAMPWKGIIELLQGRSICIIDATPHNKELPDSIKFGVTTFALVFNRALRERVHVAPWQTREMVRAAGSKKHKPLVNRIRRLERVFGNHGPITMGEEIVWEVHKNFRLDDKPEELGIICNLTTAEETSF